MQHLNTWVNQKTNLMAKRLYDIYDEMITAKDAKPELAGLAPQGYTLDDLIAAITTNSKVALWHLKYFVVAVAIYALEELFDDHTNTVQQAIDTAQFGTPQWFREKMMAFQYGDAVVRVNNKPAYATIDPTKQIIKRASVVENPDGSLLLKVATENGGQVVPLSTVQLAAFDSYMAQHRYPGMRFGSLSQNPDQLDLDMDVYYDAQYPWSDLEPIYLAAIDNYLANDIDFDGTFYTETMVDALQTQKGFRSHRLNSIEAQVGVNAIVAIDRAYPTTAGYMVARNITLNPIPYNA